MQSLVVTFSEENYNEIVEYRQLPGNFAAVAVFVTPEMGLNLRGEVNRAKKTMKSLVGKEIVIGTPDNNGKFFRGYNTQYDLDSIKIKI